MINRPPELMRLPVDLHKNLAQVPTLVGIRLMMNPSLSGRCRKHRTEPVSQEPYRLVADVDAELGQNIFDLAQEQRQRATIGWASGLALSSSTSASSVWSY